MGYDVHITRKDDWSDADGPAITRAECIGSASVDAVPVAVAELSVPQHGSRKHPVSRCVEKGLGSFVALGRASHDATTGN